MSRIPSPELIRFLLSHPSLADVPIGQVESAAHAGQNEWATFDQDAVVSDLRRAAPHFGANRLVREIVQPTVLCLFGDGQDGKSSTANFFKALGVPVFSTDDSVAELGNGWHGNEVLRSLAILHVPNTIDQFIKKIEESKDYATAFMTFFFDSNHGFTHRSPLSVIQGYVHAKDANPHDFCLRTEIFRGLVERGYRVWSAERVK